MRRILAILSLILLIAISSQGQSSRPNPGNDADRIVRLYPNPATSYITFDLQANYKKGLTVQIYNGVLGKKMYETQNIPDKFTLNLNDYTRGIYIYHLIDMSGKIIESGKFQVSR
ncbi:MAG TPA: T9SS type A sorting domain-containing protein [Chitinophagaceae bacterium]|nr:T9SS type A sorting domain-containing protein [Chitinophagaceae bacterium]HNU13932.1 T9SS type A sorting domain-containing protein [Chitinophagaceae bacterium]